MFTLHECLPPPTSWFRSPPYQRPALAPGTNRLLTPVENGRFLATSGSNLRGGFGLDLMLAGFAPDD